MTLGGRSLGSTSLGSSGSPPPPRGGQGAPLHHRTAIVLLGDPVIEDAGVVQRDTLSSYLADVSFAVYHPPGTDCTLTVEWRRGTTDPWSVASAQTYDRQHDDDDTFPLLTGLPISTPGKAFNYVWQPFFDLPEGTFTDVYVRITVVGSSSVEEIVGPLSISTEAPTSTNLFAQAQAVRALRERTPRDFLGCGLTTPFRRTSRDFANDCEVELIRSTVSQVLGTRAAHGEFLGDLEWRPEFGNKLWVLRHRRNDSTLRGQAIAYVLEALAFEPRVVVTLVEPESDIEADTLNVRVRYKIITENVSTNRVVQPEYEEVVVVA